MNEPITWDYITVEGTSPPEVLAAVRQYHTRGLLIRNTERIAVRGQPAWDCPLTQCLFDIPGITGFAALPYQVNIGKAHSYTWEELHPQILEALKKTQASIRKPQVNPLEPFVTVKVVQ